MQQFFTDYLERMEWLHRGFAEAISGLPPEGLEWTPGPEINSLHVLIVHTTGSARFWVGDVALGEPSGRNRDAEFQMHGLGEAALKARLEASAGYIRSALDRLKLADLDTPRPAPGSEQPVTVGWALLHALEHTALHLGHAQITRQLREQRGASGS